MANTHEDQQLMARRMTERENQLADGEWTPEQLLEKIKSGELSVMPRLASIDETEMPESEWIMPEQEHQLLTFLHKDVLRLAVELFPELNLAVHRTILDDLKKAVTELDSKLGEKLEDFKNVDQTYSNFSDVAAISLARQYLQYRDVLRDEVERRKQHKPEKIEKPTLKPLLTPGGFLRGAADPINAFIIEACTPGAMQETAKLGDKLDKLEAKGLTGIGKYTAVHVVESNKKDLFGVIGYPKDVGEALFKFLQNHGALAVQAHIALFARAYAETDAAPREYITLYIPEFCDDLRFTRNKGGHRKETKDRVLELLECLTNIELKIIHSPPEAKRTLLTGPIWQRGISQSTEHQSGKFEPDFFRYAPGEYFEFNSWRHYARNVALIGAGLLELDAKNDKWAIHGGGYLALLGRMNGYRSQPLDASTLLEKTGLLRVYGKLRKTSLMEEKLTALLDKLVTVKVIEKWDWTRLESDSDSKKLASKSLLNRGIEITYRDDLKYREEKLAADKAKHIDNATKNSVVRTP